MPRLPQRIVCLTTETVEVLYALGEQDRIVGISGYTVRRPKRARKSPRSSPSPAATSTRFSPPGPIWC
jgi:iron complex transport system substrate-binding protein